MTKRSTPCPKVDYELPESEYISRFDCLYVPVANVKYIMGPCTYYHFKYNNRNFFLFGEQHKSLARDSVLIDQTPDMTPENTLLFPSFVNSLVLDNKDETFDLMYESIYFRDRTIKSREILTSPLASPTSNIIANQFAKCIVPENRVECPYHNLRVHYIDYRVRGYTVPTKFTEQQFIDGIYMLLREHPKITKQIAAMSPEMRIRLYLYIGAQLAPCNIAKSMHSDVLIMDIYAIARIFRDFDKTIDKYNKQFRGTSGNVLYYAGARHVANIVEFLKDCRLPEVGKIDIVYDDSAICKSFIKLPSRFPDLSHY